MKTYVWTQVNENHQRKKRSIDSMNEKNRIEDDNTKIDQVRNECRSFISRTPGQHRRVSAVIDRKVWQVDTLRLTDTLESSEVKRVIKNETEKERKRKMSAPYGASVEITDMQFHERCRRLSNVHEDLFKLFSIHNAVVQRKFEQQRLVTEVNKQLVLEELQRKSAQKAVKYAVEIERERRIKILQEMAQGKSDNALEIADMNARLSKVHIELKDAFRYIWEKEGKKEQERLRKASEAKREVIKVASVAQQSSKLEDIEKIRDKEVESLQTTEQFRRIVQDKLKDIQEELASIFGIFKERMKLRVVQDKEIDTNFQDEDESVKESMKS
ncbi:inner centromere protein-like [Rhopilema esculentum]|uniref:inner centromere protein-like n=1 Tax=Rhopilema esculentum TaxID=499914 RepID=UPI0031D15FB7